MKKSFVNPEIEIIEIDSDIICLSVGPGIILPDDPLDAGIYEIENGYVEVDG